MGNRYSSDLAEGWKGSFLAALGAGTTVARAAEACKVSVPHLYRLRQRDVEFAAEWDEARRVRRELIAEQGWTVVEEILYDTEHKDRLAAAKIAIDKASPGFEYVRPVDLTHRRGLTLADLINDPRSAALIEHVRAAHAEVAATPLALPAASGDDAPVA